MPHGKIVRWLQFRAQLTALAIFRIEYESSTPIKLSQQCGSSHPTTEEKSCQAIIQT